MNSSAHVRVLMLEADNVDSEGVSALVGVVREFRSGGDVQSVTRAPVRLEQAPTESPPPALPAAKRTYKARAPKAEPQRVSKGKRAAGLTPAILAAIKAAPQPNYDAIAREVYGNADATTITKVKRGVWSLCSRGQLRKVGDDTYKVVG